MLETPPIAMNGVIPTPTRHRPIGPPYYTPKKTVIPKIIASIIEAKFSYP